MKTVVKNENVQLLNETLWEGCKKIILDIHIKNERTTSSLLFFNSQTIFYAFVLHFRPAGFPLAAYREAILSFAEAKKAEPRYC
jgi:hypothetical protein